jgi:hypothetical protein
MGEDLCACSLRLPIVNGKLSQIETGSWDQLRCTESNKHKNRKQQTADEQTTDDRQQFTDEQTTDDRQQFTDKQKQAREIRNKK